LGFQWTLLSQEHRFHANQQEEDDMKNLSNEMTRSSGVLWSKLEVGIDAVGSTATR
jgi:hypothetical protein